MDERIKCAYIRETFGWDRMCDVDWELLRNNLESAEHVLRNPRRFPNADVEALTKKSNAICEFMTLEMRA